MMIVKLCSTSLLCLGSLRDVMQDWISAVSGTADTVHGLQRRSTMIVVTHEMGFARDVSTDVMFLHEGQIAEPGPPKTMFKEQNSERFRQFQSKVR